MSPVVTMNIIIWISLLDATFEITYYSPYEIPYERPCYAEYYNIAVCPKEYLTWNIVHVSDYPLRYVTRHIYIYIYSIGSNMVYNMISSLE